MGQIYEVDEAGNEKVAGTLTVTGVINANGGVIGVVTGSASVLANTTAAGNSAIAAINTADTGAVSIARGGSGQITQQAAINALTDVASAAPNFVLSNVGGNATWEAVVAVTSDTLDTFHASSTPTASTILPLNASVKYPNSVLMTGTGNGLDADSVDGIHASDVAAANKLFPLDGTAKFPNAILMTGSGNGLDSDTVDGHHAPATDIVPTAGQVLVVRSDGKYPAIDGSAITNLSIPTLPAMPYWVKADTVNFNSAALNVAANTADVALGISIPAGGVLHAVKIKHSAAFSGSGVTGVTVSVGIAGATGKYASAFDVLQGASATAFQITSGLFSENHTAATPLIANFASVGSTLNAVYAGTGAVDIWVMVSIAI